ncbi:MAG: phage integrase N-terminal SAM-like domain-containing protein [Porticoccaceae bacterium]
MRERIRTKHYSIRTEAQYVQWVRRFILYHGKRHPRDMGAPEVEAFVTHFAVDGQVAAATQNRALSAPLFLYKEVLGVDLPWLSDVTRAKRPQRLPVVLTREEVQAVLARMTGTYGLMARLLYGTGMRLRCTRPPSKKIYRCASGDTLAGSRVSSRPSARSSQVCESTSILGRGRSVPIVRTCSTFRFKLRTGAF